MEKEAKEYFERLETRKKLWPKGPWTEEPDRLQYVSDEGYDCLITRNPVGALCGYVGVKPGHPYFDKHYDDVPAHVHGGLTYANECGGHICHVTEGEDKTWWLGFDCSHYGDVSPGAGTGFLSQGSYRNIDYVKNQIAGLSKQFAEATQ